MAKVKIIVEVEGGVVNGVFSNLKSEDCEVEILDWDNAQVDENAEKQAEEIAKRIEKEHLNQIC